jgi:hypothetical protein
MIGRLQEATTGTSDLEGVTGFLGEKLGSTSEALAKGGESASEMAGGIDVARLSVEELDAALDEFAGRFDADATFRNIVEDAEGAAEAVAGLTASSYELGTGFDISTEAGRAAEAALEDLSGNLDDLIGLQREGQLEAGQFAAGQAQIEAAVRAVARQLNLTEAETQDLIDRYAAVPADVNTNLRATDLATRPTRDVDAAYARLPTSKNTDLRATDFATAKVTALQTALNGLRDRTVTVRAVSVGNVGINARAKGGDTEGLTLVGEEGPELVDFKGRAFVYTAAETRQMLKGADVTPMTGRGQGVTGVASGPRINIEQWVVDKGRDSWQDLLLAEQIFAVL